MNCQTDRDSMAGTLQRGIRARVAQEESLLYSPEDRGGFTVQGHSQALMARQESGKEVRSKLFSINLYVNPSR